MLDQFCNFFFSHFISISSNTETQGTTRLVEMRGVGSSDRNKCLKMTAIDWIIQSLLLADRDWIMLPRLSIDRNQFGRAEITVDFMNFFCNLSTKTTLFQTYFLTLSQINSKNYHFHTFFCAQTDKVESIWKLCLEFEQKKPMKIINFVLDLTWSKEVGRK